MLAHHLRINNAFSTPNRKTMESTVNCNAAKLNLPEEGVMFNANLPQSLGSPVVR